MAINIAPYIEGSSPNYALPVLTGGMDTSGIDAYRQGVELSLEKHRQLGNAKISCGYDNHQLIQQQFGEGNNLEENLHFQDVDLFDPIKYIQAQISGGDLTQIFTFPIQIGDNDQRENTNFDGVIEPLVIRAKVSFFSIDAPFEAHDVHGTAGAGNTDPRRTTSQVSQFYDLPNRIIVSSSRLPVSNVTSLAVNFGGQITPTLPQFYYLDAFETMGSITLPVAFSDSVGSDQPYTDGLTVLYNNVHTKATVQTCGGVSNFSYNSLQLKRGAKITSHELLDIAVNASPTPMLNALLAMTSSTESYVPNKMRSMPTGHTYDDAPLGVDSLAFGGMTYR